MCEEVTLKMVQIGLLKALIDALDEVNLTLVFACR